MGRNRGRVSAIPDIEILSDHGMLARRPHAMKHSLSSRVNRKKAKTVLRLPDLEFAKTAVLSSLTSLDAQRGDRHAIDEFVDWYCSESRLAFNRIVVLRYRTYLETRQLASGTSNLRLCAVRRLAYEAAAVAHYWASDSSPRRTRKRSRVIRLVA